METKSENDNVASSVPKTKKVKKNTILIIEEDDKCEVKKNNDICEYIEQIDINFKKCVKGYHLINSSSINETIWEDINAIIFSSSGIDIYSKSDGSHSSGMDINSSLGRISNKSAKYADNKKSIDLFFNKHKGLILTGLIFLLLYLIFQEFITGNY